MKPSPCFGVRTGTASAVALLAAVLIASLAGCSSSRHATRHPRRPLEGRIGLAPAVQKGNTNDYYLTLATAEMERRLRDRELDFVSPGELVAECRDLLGATKPGAKQAKQTTKALIDAMKAKDFAALILFQVEMNSQKKVVSRDRSSFIPHIGIGIGPVGIGTSIRPSRKSTLKLFYSVEILVNVFDVPTGRAIYVTRAFDYKSTDEPEKMIPGLCKKVAKRVEKALKKHYDMK